MILDLDRQLVVFRKLGELIYEIRESTRRFSERIAGAMCVLRKRTMLVSYALAGERGPLTTADKVVIDFENLPAIDLTRKAEELCGYLEQVNLGPTGKRIVVDASELSTLARKFFTDDFTYMMWSDEALNEKRFQSQFHFEHVSKGVSLSHVADRIQQSINEVEGDVAEIMRRIIDRSESKNQTPESRRAEIDTSGMVTQSATSRQQAKSASPIIGFLGGSELTDALGVHPSRREAFWQQLGRLREELGDACWQESTNPRPNAPKYTYRADSPKIREIAMAYQNPVPN